MKIYRSILLVSLGLLSALTYAGGRHEGTIASVEAGNPDGAVFFTTIEGTITYGCPNAAGYFVPGTYATDKVLSLLMAAKIAGNKVYFDVDCQSGGSYPVVIRVGMK